jgi:hypothetical protein
VKTNTAIAVVAGLLALVAVAFLVVFRDSGTAYFQGPFGISGSLEGRNPAPAPGAIAGEDLSAANEVGGDVDVKRAAAEGDITLGVKSKGNAAAPK